MRYIATSTIAMTAIMIVSAAKFSPADEKEAAKPAKQQVIKISKETTRILEPLREDGYPDYIKALDDQIRQGVTAENNVAVPLWQALGPKEIGEDARDEYFRRLGIKSLPEDGPYLIDFFEYVDKKLADDASPDEDEAHDMYDAALERPWTTKEMPVVAQWLKTVEPQRKLFLEASRRPRYYSPMISSDDDANHSAMVISVMLPAISQFRNAARVLMIHAMHELGEGNVDAAWEEIIAIHRLSRTAGQGTTLIDALVSYAIDGIASGGVEQVVKHGKLAARQANKFRADLAALPPPPSSVDKIDNAERFMYLDCVCVIARVGPDALDALTDGVDDDLAPNALKRALTNSFIDWNTVLRMGNRFYDRLVAAGKMKDAGQREKAMDKIDEDIKKVAAAVKKGLPGTPLLLLGGKPGRQMISKHMGGIFISLLLPALNSVMHAEMRTTTQLKLADTALALAAYRADQGEYPVELSALVPKYIKRLSKDDFFDEPLRYERRGSGFLLYSIGRNREDDDGRYHDDEPKGDDISIKTFEKK